MRLRKGFTLIELLVVIAIIAILAAILFPVFAETRNKARQTTSTSNCKQLGTAFMMYLTDYDETFPLGIGKISSSWLWNYYHATPHNWRAHIGPTHPAYQAYLVHWSNSIQPYIKNWDMYKSPACPDKDISPTEYPNALVKPASVTYTYNGLLHSLSLARVARPSQLPLAWEGRGKASAKGFALTNPVLMCNLPDSTSRPCTYSSCTNGAPNGDYDAVYPKSAMFVLDGPMWIYGNGAIFVSADGSAKWRRLAAQTNPHHTDWRVDPYTGYDNNGYPGYYWWDGCNAWLFRPDYEFNI